MNKGMFSLLCTIKEGKCRCFIAFRVEEVSNTDEKTKGRKMRIKQIYCARTKAVKYTDQRQPEKEEMLK